MCVCVREREREADRQTDRQTEKQRETWANAEDASATTPQLSYNYTMDQSDSSTSVQAAMCSFHMGRVQL